MKVIIKNIYIGAYFLSLRIFDCLFNLSVVSYQPLLYLIYNIPYLRRKMKMKGLTVEEYIEKNEKSQIKNRHDSHKGDPESFAMMSITILSFLIFLSITIALKLLFKDSFGVILVKKNMVYILLSVSVMASICTFMVDSTCDLNKERKRYNRLSRKTQNKYIKYFLLFCMAVLLLFRVAHGLLNNR